MEILHFRNLAKGESVLKFGDTNASEGTYGVIDVRTNKLITEITHKEIDVCTKVIVVDSDTF